MATYRPSFVDISGLTSGISKGLQIAAEVKRKQEALAESKIEEFMKSYQPGKLRQMDIMDFTKSYNNYKQSALNYSKLNRGGGRAEDISMAKALMDKSLGELNDVYTRSVSAAEKQKEYSEFIKTTKLKGYNTPNEVSTIINSLASTPISQLKVNEIPSAYSFDLVPKNVEWDKYGKMLDATGAKIGLINTDRSLVPFGKGLDGKPLQAVRVIQYQGRPAAATVDIMKQFAQTDSQIANGAKLDYQILAEGIKNGSTSSIDRFNEIKQYFPNIKTIEDVDPMMVFTLPLYRKSVKDDKLDYKPAETALRIQSVRAAGAREDARIVLTRQKMLKEDVKEKRGQIDPVAHISEFEANIKKDPRYNVAKNAKNEQYIDVPDVKGFSGVPNYKFANANVEYIRFFPKSGKYQMKTSEPGSKPIILSSKEIKNKLTQGTRGATNKPYIVEDDLLMPTEQELNASGIQIDPALQEMLKGINFGGGG